MPNILNQSKKGGTVRSSKNATLNLTTKTYKMDAIDIKESNLIDGGQVRLASELGIREGDLVSQTDQDAE